jgi:hypothetical protein
VSAKALWKEPLKADQSLMAWLKASMMVPGTTLRMTAGMVSWMALMTVMDGSDGGALLGLKLVAAESLFDGMVDGG